MDRTTRLEAIAEIRNLKARYFRYMDCKLWDALGTVFTTDMQVLTPEGEVWMDGGANYAASLRSSLTTAVSCHQGLTGEVEVHDEVTASGIWAMQDIIAWADQHPRYGWKSIIGRGHYHENYRLESGAWRISTLTLTRLRLDIVWPDGSAEAGATSAI